MGYLNAVLLGTIVLLGLMVAVMFQQIEAKNERLGEQTNMLRTAAEDIDKARAVNELNARNVDRMLAQAAEDNRRLADLAGQLQDIQAQQAESAAAIQNLKDASDEDRADLERALRDSVRAHANAPAPRAR